VRLPFTVIVVAILFIVGGIISLVWGLVETATGGVGWLTGLVTFSESVRVWGGSTLWSGLVGLVSGATQVAAGIGLFLRQTWAWIVALIFSGLWLVNALIDTFSGNPWAIFGAIVPGFCIVVLLSTAARQAFHQIPT
jgi:hypothetical protein